MTDGRLRILQVSASDRMGGAEKVARSLHERYRAAGHGSWMAVGAKTTDDADVFLLDHDRRRGAWARATGGLSRALGAAERVKGVKRVRLLLRDAVGQPRRTRARRRGEEDFDFPATADCLALPPERADVLHLHNLHAPGGYFDLRALPALSAAAPTLTTLHDAWLLSGHCAHGLGCGRWETGCGRCPDLSIYPAVPRDATAFNWGRKRDLFERSRLHVITPSRWLMGQVERSMLAPAVASARVIPNGVDLTVFRPGDRAAARAALGLPQGAAVLLFAANGIRSNPFKDYRTMRAAMERVARAFAGELVMLALGEASPEERLGPAATLRFVPFVSDDATVACYYRAADLYLHPARADTFPTSVLEAMACGQAVVASDVGGIPEQVIEGETGRLTAVGDPAAMAGAVLALLGDLGRREGMGVRAAEVARERFDVNDMVARYLDAYRGLLPA